MTKINLLHGRLGSGGRRIPLTQGQSTVVDDEDFERLSAYKWCAQWSPCTQSYYAVRKVCIDGKWTNQSMHREVLGLQPGNPKHVDHVDHNTLDNRRANLRIVTPRENHENRSDQSKFGVGVRKKRNRFEVQAWSDGRQRYLGTFDTPEEAQHARREFLANVS